MHFKSGGSITGERRGTDNNLSYYLCVAIFGVAPSLVFFTNDRKLVGEEHYKGSGKDAEAQSCAEKKFELINLK